MAGQPAIPASGGDIGARFPRTRGRSQCPGEIRPRHLVSDRPGEHPTALQLQHPVAAGRGERDPRVRDRPPRGVSVEPALQIIGENRPQERDVHQPPREFLGHDRHLHPGGAVGTQFPKARAHHRFLQPGAAPGVREIRYRTRPELVGPHTAGDAYICGLEPFMELVENALPGPGRIFSERFGSAPAEPAPAATEEGTVTIFLNRKKKSVPRRDGETLLESARRAGLAPPFSCESGNCATCMAKLTAVKATMRVNDGLTDDDLDEGYILTCQAVPDTPSVTVRYE